MSRDLELFKKKNMAFLRLIEAKKIALNFQADQSNIKKIVAEKIEEILRLLREGSFNPDEMDALAAIVQLYNEMIQINSNVGDKPKSEIIDELLIKIRASKDATGMVASVQEELSRDSDEFDSGTPVPGYVQAWLRKVKTPAPRLSSPLGSSLPQPVSDDMGSGTYSERLSSSGAPTPISGTQPSLLGSGMSSPTSRDRPSSRMSSSAAPTPVSSRVASSQPSLLGSGMSSPTSRDRSSSRMSSSAVPTPVSSRVASSHRSLLASGMSSPTSRDRSSRRISSSGIPRSRLRTVAASSSSGASAKRKSRHTGINSAPAHRNADTHLSTSSTPESSSTVQTPHVRPEGSAKSSTPSDQSRIKVSGSSAPASSRIGRSSSAPAGKPTWKGSSFLYQHASKRDRRSDFGGLSQRGREYGAEVSSEIINKDEFIQALDSVESTLKKHGNIQARLERHSETEVTIKGKEEESSFETKIKFNELTGDPNKGRINQHLKAVNKDTGNPSAVGPIQMLLSMEILAKSGSKQLYIKKCTNPQTIMKAIMLANAVGIEPKIEDASVEQALKEHFCVDNINVFLEQKPDMSLQCELGEDALQIIQKIKSINNLAEGFSHSAPSSRDRGASGSRLD